MADELKPSGYESNTTANHNSPTLSKSIVEKLRALRLDADDFAI
jgi:hypothetical protein